MSKNKKEDFKILVISFLLLAGTVAMLFLFAVRAMDEGYTPTEVYKETCIRPTLNLIERKNHNAETAEMTEKVANKPLPPLDFAALESAISSPAETPHKAPAIRYPLTEAERTEIERVVMAECGAEPYEGIIAVAQCILNACEKSGKRPPETIRTYKYTPIRKTPSEAVKKAVSEVFDEGKTATDECILYFYAHYYGDGTWHEKQQFVVEIGGHRFFSDPIITK